MLVEVKESNTCITVVQDGNDQNHEGGEIKLPDQRNKHETKLQTQIAYISRERESWYNTNQVKKTYYYTNGDGDCVYL